MKRATKAKTFMGVPVTDWNSAYCMVKVRVIGRKPRSASGRPQEFEIEPDQWKHWKCFEFAKEDALKFNRRSLRSGSRRWAVVFHDSSFVRTKEHIDTLRHRGKCGFGEVHTYVAHNDYDFVEGGAPFMMNAHIKTRYLAANGSVTPAEIVKELRNAVDAYEAAMVKAPKRSKRGRGLKLIA